MIAAKAGPVVSSAVNNFVRSRPNATNAQVKQWVLEHFSNVGTKAEAFHYLGEMRVEMTNHYWPTMRNTEQSMKWHMKSHQKGKITREPSWSMPSLYQRPHQIP